MASYVFEDTWMKWVNDWSGSSTDTYVGVLNPRQYSTAVLSDYLVHVTSMNLSDALHDFLTRKAAGFPSRRPPTFTAFRAPNDISEVCVIVGQPFLSEGVDSMDKLCQEGYTVKYVSLPSTHVLHSGVAVSHLMATLDNGVLGSTLGVNICKDCRINVIHCEGGFKRWPANADEPVWKNRFDNLKHVLRSGGVDAGATYLTTGRRVRPVLDERWKTFCGVGVGSWGFFPCFGVDLDAFVQAMHQRRKNVLTDTLLLGGVVEALKGDRSAGIECWDSRAGVGCAAECVRYYADTPFSTLVLILSPEGTCLSNFPCRSHVRRTPEDIFF